MVVFLHLDVHGLDDHGHQPAFRLDVHLRAARPPNCHSHDNSWTRGCTWLWAGVGSYLEILAEVLQLDGPDVEERADVRDLAR